MANYGLIIGGATEGFRQGEQDIKRDESFDMQKEGFAMKKEAFSTDQEKSKLQIEAAKKQLTKEGAKEALSILISGDVRGAENHFNTVGEKRIQQGSLTYNRKNGILSWVDSENGTKMTADIRMMSAMLGVKLPSKAGASSSDFWKAKNYGLSLNRQNLAERKHQSDRQKKARDTFVGNMGGKRDAMGQYSLPQGNEERTSYGMSIVDRIEQSFPEKFTAGRLSDVVKKHVSASMTMKDAERRATAEASDQAGLFSTDKTDFGGPREVWIAKRAREIYKAATKDVERKVLQDLKLAKIPTMKQLEYLQTHDSPRNRKYFDSIFGKGASDRILKKKK